MERIRGWIGRHWCRDLPELRRQLAAVQETSRGLEAQIAARDATIRDLTRRNAMSLAEMAEMAAAHKRLLAKDLSGDLARIITTVRLVGCRLDALAERMGLGVVPGSAHWTRARAGSVVLAPEVPP